MSSENFHTVEGGSQAFIHDENLKQDLFFASPKWRGIEKAFEKQGIPMREVLKPGARVLEIGSGHGQNQHILRSIIPGLKYTEIEKDPHAAETSRARNPEGTVVCGDVLTEIQKIPDGSLDCVLGFNSFDQYTYAELKVLLRAIARKLRSGGVFMHGIDQNQASVPLWSYLEERRRTPDGKQKGYPFVYEQYLPEGGGFTTGLIFLMSKKDRATAIAEMEARYQKALRSLPADQRTRLFKPRLGSEIVTDASIDAVRNADLNKGHQLVDHNKLLAAILDETMHGIPDFLSVGYHRTTGREVHRRDRGEQSSVLFKSYEPADQATLREADRLTALVEPVATGLAKSLVRGVDVRVHTGLYAIGVKR
jgi:SAM-dependent methyltransferase